MYMYVYIYIYTHNNTNSNNHSSNYCIVLYCIVLYYPGPARLGSARLRRTWLDARRDRENYPILIIPMQTCMVRCPDMFHPGVSLLVICAVLDLYLVICAVFDSEESFWSGWNAQRSS